MTVDLAHLKNNPGAHHRTKRYGCGIGSGHGKTSGRGGKGQTARTGSSIRPGFEGGQMPLYRRLPKRGFHSFDPEAFALINVESLNQFSDGDVVGPSELKARGLVRGFEKGIKILGDGELKKKLTVVASAFSNSAIKKIESAAGECRIATKAVALKNFRGEGPIDIKSTAQAKPRVPTHKPVKSSRPEGRKEAVAQKESPAAVEKKP